MKPVACRHCKEPFIPEVGHPGFFNECPQCLADRPASKRDVPLLMAKVAWSGKHFPEIEITADRNAAIAFNSAQRRHGHGPISAIGSVIGTQLWQERMKSGNDEYS